MRVSRVLFAFVALFGVWFAYGEYPKTMDAAVEVAEEFIVANGYSTKRACPDKLREKEKISAYDMQRPCRDYDASESRAYAAVDAGLFWQVFFRKSPPDIEQGKESFRVVRIYQDVGVRLHDIELYLDPEATILKQK